MAIKRKAGMGEKPFISFFCGPKITLKNIKNYIQSGPARGSEALAANP